MAGKREGEEPVQNTGPPRRREVQPGGTGLPLHHRCGKAGPAEEDAGDVASEWERRERRERRERGEKRRAETEELGAEGEEQSLFLTTHNSLLQDLCGRGLGGESHFPL